MRMFFASALGSALIIAAIAQQSTPPVPPAPPPVSTAPPPLVPNITPARPQPGVATGATGGIGSLGGSPRSTANRVSTNAAGVTPFPVIVPANTFPMYPEVFDPLALIDLYRTVEAPTTEGAARGRPGGLGVTITGGDASGPAGGGVTVTGGSASPPAATNAAPVVPAATNAPPISNATGRVPNSKYR